VIDERLAEVRARIARAARAAGRDAESIRLVAVSKQKPADAVRAAYAAGQRDFGENYVQELVKKAEALKDLADVRWHMIGHLQRNKVRMLTPHAAVVHSVDSERLAEELGKRANPLPPGRRAFDLGDDRLAVLVEVNVAGEVQKSGSTPSALGLVLDSIERQPRLRLLGLMTIPPHTDDPAGARRYFDELLELREKHGGARRLPELSMGMTHDLEHAILAGATLVRVGTAIFGERTQHA